LEQSSKQLKVALLRGPVIISIDASSVYFKLYKGGIMRNFKYTSVCGQKINHSMLAVGYGADLLTGESYLLLKNSWGIDWGE
jgi:C1A family cysteine protease